MHKKYLLVIQDKLDMVLHACNPNMWKAEAKESRLQGQSEVHSEILSKKI